MSKESLELLEHEFVTSLQCGVGGCENAPVAVAVMRDRCAAGGDLSRAHPDYLVCADCRNALLHAPIEAGTVCCGCGNVVGGHGHSHIIARVVPLVPSC